MSTHKKGRNEYERSTLILVIALLLGGALLAYPSIANFVNSFSSSGIMAGYTAHVEQMDTSERDQLLNDAQTYNEELASAPDQVGWAEDHHDLYESTLNSEGNGLIGSVRIKKINVDLPIFHGTDDTTLATAIGHIDTTSLPVGGPSTHAVLSGHRGLPSAVLFSNLDQMDIGDTFQILVMGKTLTYEVDQIRIVLPNETDEIKVVEGEDLCTLSTCTPYGVNTHRLLVRGHRIPNPSASDDFPDATVISRHVVALAIAAVILAGVSVVVMVRTSTGWKQRHPGT